jgi:Xaa-Pro aminopeptidase
VTRLPNVFYLTNLGASSALAVCTPTQLYLITDFRYSAAVHRLLASDSAAPATTLRLVDASYDEALARVLGETGARRVGFEAGHVSVRQHGTWAGMLTARGMSAELVATDAVIEGMRIVKDAFEIRVLREAALRLSEVARGVLSELAVPGRPEADVAADIDLRIKRMGFERTAFDTIVAAGPNAALPHARPGDRALADGDLVVLDFGGVYHGYCVDLTRTVALGRVQPEQRRLYRAVLEAQRRAIASVADGTLSGAVDAAARDWLTAQGLGEAFGHSTGHGLGLDVHEEPRIARVREGGLPPVTLRRGMVFTIEPGAYVTDFGGVRLEDDVLIGEEGCEVLTDVPFDDRLM